MWAGVVAITGKGADWLKTLDENFSSIYCFNFGIFLLVGANGIAEGLVVVFFLLDQICLMWCCLTQLLIRLELLAVEITYGGCERQYRLFS